tara:strand:+ start:340 stop:1398 length:1059 start_codon:yes stop_codon:yes gene_type:complete
MREILSSLVGKGYLMGEKKSSMNAATRRSITWEELRLTQMGKKAAANLRDMFSSAESASGNASSEGSEKVLNLIPKDYVEKIMLPVPASLRAEEEAKEKRKEATRKTLEESGVDMRAIPEYEIQEGDGEVIRSHMKWIAMLQSYETGVRKPAERGQHLQELLQSLLEWRAQTAEELSMAPASVMPTHIAQNIAMVLPMDPDGLRSVGVRVKGSEKICDIIREWKNKHGLLRNEKENEGVAGTTEQWMDQRIEVPSGIYLSPVCWKHNPPYSAPKRGKDGQILYRSWELSWMRFHELGESITGYIRIILLFPRLLNLPTSMCVTYFKNLYLSLDLCLGLSPDLNCAFIHSLYI